MKKSKKNQILIKGKTLRAYIKKMKKDLGPIPEDVVQTCQNKPAMFTLLTGRPRVSIAELPAEIRRTKHLVQKLKRLLRKRGVDLHY